MILSAEVGGVLFESFPRDLQRGFVVEPNGWSGWDSGVQVRRQETVRPVAHGAFAAPGFLGPRVRSVAGNVIASSKVELEHMCRRLTGLLADGDVGRVSVESDLDTTWADVQLADRPTIEEHVGGLEARFQVQFWSPDPRRYGETRPFTGASVQAFHYGNFSAIPEVTVVGPVTGPYTVASQGKQVTVTQSLTGGQSHRIDMSTGWVYRNGVLQSGVVSALELFTIPPGAPVQVTGPASMTVTVTDTFI